ncbi:MAG: type II toxin-antitoxin system PemK/MazF family toxin [Thermoanaerobaculia bacterium]
MKLQRGSLVLVALDPVLGHEQRGMRPCVVVSSPAVVSNQRYPLLAVIPVTGTPGEGALYPALEPGASGLRKRSWALIDQVRAIAKRRVRQIFGQLLAEELAQIDEGLKLFLGLT